MNMTGIARTQSSAEEVANSVSHGVGLIMAIAGAPFLIARAIRPDGAAMVIAMSLFASCMIVLYLASTLYHALPHGKAKRTFRTIEHSAIYLLIAGTYTPFSIGLLQGAWKWGLLSVVWMLAGVGTALKATGRASHPILSTGLYLAMGWLIVVAAVPLARAMTLDGLVLVIAGGLFYTVGVFFFAFDSRIRFGHFIWHMFVLAGTGCHYFAALWHIV